MPQERRETTVEQQPDPATLKRQMACQFLLAVILFIIGVVLIGIAINAALSGVFWWQAYLFPGIGALLIGIMFCIGGLNQQRLLKSVESNSNAEVIRSTVYGNMATTNHPTVNNELYIATNNATGFQELTIYHYTNSVTSESVLDMNMEAPPYSRIDEYPKLPDPPAYSSEIVSTTKL